MFYFTKRDLERNFNSDFLALKIDNTNLKYEEYVRNNIIYYNTETEKFSELFFKNTLECIEQHYQKIGFKVFLRDILKIDGYTINNKEDLINYLNENKYKLYFAFTQNISDINSYIINKFLEISIRDENIKKNKNIRETSLSAAERLLILEKLGFKELPIVKDLSDSDYKNLIATILNYDKRSIDGYINSQKEGSNESKFIITDKHNQEADKYLKQLSEE